MRSYSLTGILFAGLPTRGALLAPRSHVQAESTASIEGRVLTRPAGLFRESRSKPAAG